MVSDDKKGGLGMKAITYLRENGDGQLIDQFGKKIKIIKKEYFLEKIDGGKEEHKDKWWNTWFKKGDKE